MKSPIHRLLEAKIGFNGKPKTLYASAKFYRELYESASPDQWDTAAGAWLVEGLAIKFDPALKGSTFYIEGE